LLGKFFQDFIGTDLENANQPIFPWSVRTKFTHFQGGHSDDTYSGFAYFILVAYAYTRSLHA